MITDIIGDHLFAAMPADGVDVVTAGPKAAAPEHFFDFGIVLEYLPGSDAFGESDDLCGKHHGDALDKKVDMVAIRTNLHETDLVAYLDLTTCRCEGVGHSGSEYFPAVFDGTDQMVKHQVDVVLFTDVFTHIMSMPWFSLRFYRCSAPWPPPQQADGEWLD